MNCAERFRVRQLHVAVFVLLVPSSDAVSERSVSTVYNELDTDEATVNSNYAVTIVTTNDPGYNNIAVEGLCQKSENTSLLCSPSVL